MGMKREYRWARGIIVIIMVVLVAIFLVSLEANLQDLLLWIGIVAGLVWLACFLCTGISRKMIQMGDKISNKFLRGLYYFVLFPVMLAIGLGLLYLIEYVDDIKSQSYNYEQSIGEAIFVFLLGIWSVVFVLIPYVQSLFVLLMRKILKNKDEEEKETE